MEMSLTGLCIGQGLLLLIFLHGIRVSRVPDLVARSLAYNNLVYQSCCLETAAKAVIYGPWLVNWGTQYIYSQGILEYLLSTCALGLQPCKPTNNAFKARQPHSKHLPRILQS